VYLHPACPASAIARLAASWGRLLDTASYGFSPAGANGRSPGAGLRESLGFYNLEYRKNSRSTLLPAVAQRM
jgi:hypothetical protein